MARDDFDLIHENAGKNDVRGIVMRSGFAGIIATILAVAIGSPAGVGGMIGVAEGMGIDPSSGAGANTLNLPTVRPQLSEEELSSIEMTLAESNSDLDVMRALTDSDIAYLRSLAGSADALDIRS